MGLEPAPAIVRLPAASSSLSSVYVPAPSATIEPELSSLAAVTAALSVGQTVPAQIAPGESPSPITVYVVAAAAFAAQKSAPNAIPTTTNRFPTPPTCRVSHVGAPCAPPSGDSSPEPRVLTRWKRWKS